MWTSRSTSFANRYLPTRRSAMAIWAWAFSPSHSWRRWRLFPGLRLAKAAQVQQQAMQRIQPELEAIRRNTKNSLKVAEETERAMKREGVSIRRLACLDRSLSSDPHRVVFSGSASRDCRRTVPVDQRHRETGSCVDDGGRSYAGSHDDGSHDASPNQTFMLVSRASSLLSCSQRWPPVSVCTGACQHCSVPRRASSSNAR